MGAFSLFDTGGLLLGSFHPSRIRARKFHPDFIPIIGGAARLNSPVHVGFAPKAKAPSPAICPIRENGVLICAEVGTVFEICANPIQGRF